MGAELYRSGESGISHWDTSQILVLTNWGRLWFLLLLFKMLFTFSSSTKIISLSRPSGRWDGVGLLRRPAFHTGGPGK